jgi:hypothetical protein
MTLRTMSQFKLLELNERGTFVSEEALSLGQPQGTRLGTTGHDGFSANLRSSHGEK